MSNLHRILWFDQQVRGQNYPNRKSLAETFEISIRQAQRDIDYLRDSLLAPIEYDSKYKGYYYLDNSFIVPHVYINKEQKELLSFLIYSYGSYSQTPNVTQIIQLLKKLVEGTCNDVDLPIFNVDSPVVNINYKINTAVKNKNVISFVYKDQILGETSITLHPYKIFHRYKSDYVVGYCENSHDISIYRLDRMIKLDVCEEIYKVREEFESRRYSSFIEKEPFTARLKFSQRPDGISFLDYSLKEVEDLIYDIQFFDIDEFINQLINSGWEYIISPKWLKNKLREKCQRVIERMECYER